ncbi:MAG: carboxylating nicotinate-nucleotide diphosphorylase [Thermodesulfovibrionales bacterium]|nr:carboxylating nicotinate-nucleotide diphosphorylase [Thermodesulfovibrionales bacterium]
MEFLVKNILDIAFLEDSFCGDISSSLTIASDAKSTGLFKAKEDFILAGMPFVRDVFEYLSNDVVLQVFKSEGEKIISGDIIAKITGRTRDLLRGERIALNILQHVCGVATLTRAFVDLVKDLPVRIVDTRKTMPGMRMMQKYGVMVGGGYNHRFCLSDGILLKDNHIKAVGSITEAINRVRKAHHLLKIEVEVGNIEQVREAINAGADVIMLDNMSIEEMKEAVGIISKRAIVEASGGVNKDNIRAIAQTGVDIISIGALTHSVKAVDISMDID